MQNAAARMIFSLSRRDHVTPCRIQLHWLPVRFRITYKLFVLMRNIQNGKSPRYLCEIVQSTSTRTTRHDLRSCSATTTYRHTKFGERAFSFAGPASWNLLPTDLRSVSDSTVFLLKNSSRAICLDWPLTFSRCYSLLANVTTLRSGICSLSVCRL